MERIGDTLKRQQPLPTKPKQGGVNSAFNNAVDHVVQFMDEKAKFAYWCGRLRGVPVQEIWAMLSKAKEGRKPKALFNWLLKEYRAKKLSTPKVDNKA